MLETKIDKLTKAIEALTAAIEAQQTSKVSGKEESQNVDDLINEAPGTQEMRDLIAEQPKEETPSTTTHDEVKDLCLKISRADRSKKPAIKALLSEYGANTVAQVAAESLAELKAKLEGFA